jgi:K+-transporting ATPase KdpF subunit
MTAFEVIGLLLAVGLVGYLVIALLYPERFQ